MRIALIDADLLDGGTRHPNLALMKISGFHKSKGDQVILILDYNFLNNFDKVYVSKVFTFTDFPSILLEEDNVEFGGTGFYPDGNSPELQDEIEHFMPDYNLYSKYVEYGLERGIRQSFYSDYVDFSIGFTTRGCFRQCEFCVNRKFTKVFRHAPVSEFLDIGRKYIYLWDDNILGYENWKEVFVELDKTKKYFQFRQGLDVRLMTPFKAETLAKSRYFGDFIFAFDDLKEEYSITKGLEIWKEHSRKTTKLYLLCAYKSIGLDDIVELFERISILMKYQCLPYVMRYENYKQSKFVKMYIEISRWCNQPHIFKKMSFREFCLAHQYYTKSDRMSSTLRAFLDFEEEFPLVVKTYADMKFMHYGS
jgi:hypothetical protein